MDRRTLLASLGAAALSATSLGRAAEPARENAGRKGVPTLTIEELAAGLRKEGFQWKFVGQQIAFTATVLTGGAAPSVRIDGMDPGKFDTAVVHNAHADNRLKTGDKVQFRGLIVDQWYGVWQVWRYEMTALNVP